MRRVGPPFMFPSNWTPGQWFAFRSVAVSLVVVGLAAGTGARADDDLPDLSPPLDAPTVTTSPRLVNPTRPPIVSTPAPVVVRPLPAAAPTVPVELPEEPLVLPPSPSTAPSAPTAVLAIPGLTGRTSGLRPLPPISAAEVGQSSPTVESPDASGLTLDRPIDMAVDPTAPPSGRNQRFNDPIGPLGGEVVSASDPLPTDRSNLDPLPGPSTRQTPASNRRVEPRLSTHDNTRITPTPLPRRRFFGLFPGPAVVTPTPTPARTPSAGTTTDILPLGRNTRLATDHMTPEAIAEARLKLRIEKQARAAVGDRARTLEIQVEGKTASVRAQGVKFLQKRGVRKALEGLPALTGLRSTIEVLD